MLNISWSGVAGRADEGMTMTPVVVAVVVDVLS
jgi:hypothetical protein